MNRGNVGSLKTLNITPYVNEQTISIPIPTAMSTGSPQVSFTFSQATMSPAFSGNTEVLSFRNCFGMNVGLQNTSGASQTVYWQINKNGSSYKSGNNSVANNYYYNVSLADWAKDGDVYDFYIWCSTALTLNYQNCWTQPSRIDTGAKFIKDLFITTQNFCSTTYFPLTGGKIGSSWGGQVYVVAGWLSTNNQSISACGFGGNGNIYYIPFLTVHPVYKLYMTQCADAGSNSSQASNSSASVSPSTYNMQQNWFASTVSYRELFLR